MRQKLPWQLEPENKECLSLKAYLDGLVMEHKLLAYSHIPNETYTTSWTQKRKNKLLGVSSGVPDYLLVFPCKVVFIEMKAIKGGVTSDNQKVWIHSLIKGNVEAFVCHGFYEAEAAIKQILTEKDKLLVKFINNSPDQAL